MYNNEFLTYGEKITEVTNSINLVKSDKLNFNNFIKSIKQYGTIESPAKFTVEMVVSLIEKILCHQIEGKGKDRTQRIDVYWNGIGYIDLSDEFINAKPN